MMSRIAIVGAGWAGLACAVELTGRGHAVALLEAARTPGGRARSLVGPGGETLDNGQHILIGAYTHTLALMRRVGADPERLLLRLPLRLRRPDGIGLALPDLPAPWDLTLGLLLARGWSLRERLALMQRAAAWQAAGFDCDPAWTVQQLGAGLPARLIEDLIEPLCVSALNTPVTQASARVFLTVLRDALLGPRGSSHLLIPRVDLGALLPQPACEWLAARGAQLRLGQRVANIQAAAAEPGAGWRIDGENFDQLVLACPAWEAARLVRGAALAAAGMDAWPASPGLPAWAASASALQHEAIATVYLQGGPALPHPLLCLRSSPDAPAQFVFDRARLGGPPGLKAFVVSASQGDRDTLTAQVLRQAQALGWNNLKPVQTVVEKRATFACTPRLQRPGPVIASGLWACGDYLDGPYPATLEAAVRSGLSVAAGVAAQTSALKHGRTRFSLR